MSRQRFIYPEIWRSEQFLALPVEARLLFIGIFSTADDHGRHKASALSLKVEVFPVDPYTPEQIRVWRDAIAAQGMIRLYTDDDGAELLDIPSWPKFQKPRHVSDSRLAEYPGAGEIDTAGPEQRQPPGEPPSTPGEPPADDGSGVVWCGVEKSGVARRKTAKGVPGNTPDGTSKPKTPKQHVPPTPDNVVEADWQRLVASAAPWPLGGRDDGARRLGAILAANGPKDAEQRVRMIDVAWKAGKIRAPWAALGKSEHAPPDEDPTPDRGRSEPEEFGSVLSKVGSGCDPPGEG